MEIFSPEQKTKLKHTLRNSKAIILDFDGLLADSEPFHYRAYKKVFEKYNHSLDEEEYWLEWTSKGKGAAGEIERHNLELDISPADLKKQKTEVYLRYCDKGEVKLFPDALRMVEILSQNRRTAIASGSSIVEIEIILKKANALDNFPVILGNESASREKPHPEIFLNAAEKLKCDPNKCLVFEDALKGLKAAKSAGIPCIIILNELNRNINFEGADFVFPDMRTFLSTLIDIH
jgi:beta-phosphoglucomutase